MDQDRGWLSLSSLLHSSICKYLYFWFALNFKTVPCTITSIYQIFGCTTSLRLGWCAFLWSFSALIVLLHKLRKMWNYINCLSILHLSFPLSCYPSFLHSFCIFHFSLSTCFSIRNCILDLLPLKQPEISDAVVQATQLVEGKKRILEILDHNQCKDASIPNSDHSFPLV